MTNSPVSNEPTNKSPVTLEELLNSRSRSPARPLGMNNVYAEYLLSGYAAVMEELCSAHARAMGWTEPLTQMQHKELLHLAFDDLGVKRAKSVAVRAMWAVKHYGDPLDELKARRRRNRDRDRAVRRRVRKAGATLESVRRADIIARDASTCYLCGKVCAEREIHIDHVFPLSRGGAHSEENLRVSCATCNLRKGDSILAELPAMI